MKSLRLSPILSFTFVSLFLVLQTKAQTTNTWIGPTSGPNIWTNESNWSGGTIPNATDATVIFTNTANADWTNSIITVGTLNCSHASGNVVIGSTTNSNTLILATSSATPAINVSNASATSFIYTVLAGTNGFIKTGAGNLTFRFNGNAMLYSGNINLNAGTLTINQDSSLGDTNNDIIVGGNSALAFAPGANSGTVALGNGRSLTINSGTLSVQTTSNAITGVINGLVSGAGGLTLVGPSSVGSNAATANGYTLNGANTYAGQTTIQMGAKLTLGSGASIGTNTLSLSGGNGSYAEINLGGNTQSVASLTTASSTATPRSMVISNGALNVGSSGVFTLNGINGTTVNLSGLTSFTFNGAAGNRNFTITPDTVSATATNTNSVFLANTGIASNNISAGAMTVGGAAGISQGGIHQGQLYLGKVNTINANTLQLGGFNGTGLIALNGGLSSGTLTLRGSNGVGRMSNLVVGATSSGTRDGGGTLNLSNGTVDALVITSTIGQFVAAANISSTSLLAMNDGTFDATTLWLGQMYATNGPFSAAPTINATFQQNGGTNLIGNMVMGDGLYLTNSTNGATVNSSAGPVYKSTYNLRDGILAVQSVTATNTNYTATTATVRQIVMSGGVLKNYPGTNAVIDGVASSENGGYIYVKTAGASQKFLLVDSNRTFTLGAKTFLQIDSGELVIDAPNATFSSSARVGISRGLTNNGILTLSNGTANFNTAGGTLGLADNSSATGRINVYGGTMNITVSGSRFLIGNKGTGVVAVSNGATLNIDGANDVCVGSDFQFPDTSGDDLGNGAIDLNGGNINVRGAGRLVLGAYAPSLGFSGTGTLNLNNGTFASARSIERDANTNNTDGRGSATVNFNGATLKALTNNSNWITVTNLFVNADTIIDTETNNVNVQTGFLAGSNGVAKIIKAGSGTLTLSGINTYTGDTDVNAGALSLLGTVASPSINVAGGAALVLSTAPIGSITNNLAFSDGAKVSVSGAPSGSTVNLLTTSGTIIGSPTLETAVLGYTLVTSSTAITLQASGDTTPPTIDLRGDNPLTIALGATFTDPGADVADNVDATRQINGTDTVNVNQAGSYIVTYSASDAANNAATSVDRTVNVLKGTPTLTSISASPINQGQSFSDSIVTGNAQYNGSNVGGTWAFVNGQTLNGSGTYNVVFNPTDTSNYNSSTGTVSLTVNPAGASFADWSSGGATNSELVGKYAIGGASNSAATGEKPVATVDSNTLSLSAIVRTNDAKLNVVGEAGGSLTNWSTNGISVTASTNTNGVPDGHQRRVFSVDRTNAPTKQFLRLRATLQP